MVCTLFHGVANARFSVHGDGNFKSGFLFFGAVWFPISPGSRVDWNFCFLVLFAIIPISITISCSCSDSNYASVSCSYSHSFSCSCRERSVDGSLHSVYGSLRSVDGASVFPRAAWQIIPALLRSIRLVLAVLAELEHLLTSF